MARKQKCQFIAAWFLEAFKPAHGEGAFVEGPVGCNN